MERRPGTPSLLRELNDRTGLELLLKAGPMTRSQLGESTGLSKVTASQLLTRLTDRGLVTVVGAQTGVSRGPNAALYGVVPSTAYVAGLHVEHHEVSAAVADVTGATLAEVSVDPTDSANPVALVRSAVGSACAAAGIEMARLRAFVIGTPGVLDPRTGDLRLAVNLPAWHEGVLDALKSGLERPVTIENDVNLAAMAEHAVGAAVAADDFVLVWSGIGLGLATMLGGRLHRGASGAAGEIGYLPVPGVPLPQDVTHPATGAFQSLAGAQVVADLAAGYGFTQPVPRSPDDAGRSRRTVAAIRVAAAVAAAADGDQAANAFLADLGGRVATGVASICVVLDPGLVVLGGEIGQAGGAELCRRVAAEVSRICPARPVIVPTAVPSAPVLRGAVLAAVGQARAELLASVAQAPR